MKEILFQSRKSPSSDSIAKQMNFDLLINELRSEPKQNSLFDNVPLENYEQVTFDSSDKASLGRTLMQTKFLIFSSN